MVEVTVTGDRLLTCVLVGYQPFSNVMKLGFSDSGVPLARVLIRKPESGVVFVLVPKDSIRHRKHAKKLVENPNDRELPTTYSEIKHIA